MLENSPKADNWDSHWQELSKDIYFNTPAVRYRWKCLERLIGLNHQTSSPAKLIDIGCGTGRLLKYFSNCYSNIQLKGTDNSFVGLEIAKQSLPQGIFFQADLCTQQYEPTAPHREWATHAICSEVLEHLDEPVIFLNNAGKFLQNNATLVVSVPGGPMSSFDHQVGHRKHYTAKMLENELTQAGYKVEKTACAGFPFHNLYRLAFILRGESILNDAKQQEQGNSSFVSFVMNCFDWLFKFNLLNTRFGWTVLAKASWQGDRPVF